MENRASSHNEPYKPKGFEATLRRSCLHPQILKSYVNNWFVWVIAYIRNDRRFAHKKKILKPGHRFQRTNWIPFYSCWSWSISSPMMLHQEKLFGKMDLKNLTMI